MPNFSILQAAINLLYKEENIINRITEITKRDILDLFRVGLEIDDFFQTQTINYN